MADLLSSTDEEGEFDETPTPSISRARLTGSVSGIESAIPASSLGTTDRSQSESDLIDSLLTASESTATTGTPWKGSSKTRRRSTLYSGDSHRETDEKTRAAISAQDTKKPAVSARDMLMRFFPTTSQKSHLIVSTPTKSPSSATTIASPSIVRSVRSRSPATPARASVVGDERRSQEAELTASERIAMKYGLIRDASPGVSTHPTPAAKRDRNSIGATDKRRDASEYTPERPATAPPTRERSPFWDTETDAERKTGTTYVSPFRSKDALVDIKKRRRLSAGSGARRQEPFLRAQAIYDDSKDGTADIGGRPRHVIASSITAPSGTGKESDGEESGDDWMSDAKDIAAEQKERAAANVRSVLLATAEKNALPTGKSPSKSQKRFWRRQAGSEDESDIDGAECWPRLPPPEVCNTEIHRHGFCAFLTVCWMLPFACRTGKVHWC